MATATREERPFGLSRLFHMKGLGAYDSSKPHFGSWMEVECTAHSSRPVMGQWTPSYQLMKRGIGPTSCSSNDPNRRRRVRIRGCSPPRSGERDFQIFGRRHSLVIITTTTTTPRPSYRTRRHSGLNRLRSSSFRPGGCWLHLLAARLDLNAFHQPVCGR